MEDYNILNVEEVGSNPLKSIMAGAVIKCRFCNTDVYDEQTASIMCPYCLMYDWNDVIVYKKIKKEIIKEEIKEKKVNKQININDDL